MLDFLKKKKEIKVLTPREILDVTFKNNKKRYVETLSEIAICSHKDTAMKYFDEEYENATAFFAQIFDTYFGNEVLDDEVFNDYYHNLDGFKETFINEGQTRQDVLFFFKKPLIDDIVYINRRISTAHLHIQDMIVTESEFAYTLFKDNHFFTSENFDKFLEGKDIEWVYELLKRMQVLSQNSDLEEKISNYRAIKRVQKEYFHSVICKLINCETNMEIGVRKAMIFANYFGVDFDFRPFINEQEMKLSKKC